MVTYNEYMTFMQDVLKRDFELVIEEDEEKELIAYIFDKLKMMVNHFLMNILIRYLSSVRQ